MFVCMYVLCMYDKNTGSKFSMKVIMASVPAPCTPMKILVSLINFIWASKLNFAKSCTSNKNSCAVSPTPNAARVCLIAVLT